ncbi:hypothetical protein [Bacillus safensis]|uniref:hypothetical protein n=1 Tax=Bacillus safensis TaxID=561879 RepID=UPI0024536814|nr:hypothetical protein [Bacillus safensis]MDH3097075.1 hypothetical protein [Bacillus safensis]
MDFETVRIDITESSARGSEFLCIVETNSTHQPLVTLAENSGFPAVQDVYAIADTRNGIVGAVIKVRCTDQIRGSGVVALNLAQPGMTGNYKVTPLY